MNKRIEFFVPGKAAPGGSKTPGRTKAGKAYLRPASERTKPWMQTVAAYAKKAYRGPLLDGPLCLRMRFYQARPKSHYGTGRNARVLKANAPIWPTGPPDLTKLVRAAEDALTDIIFVDDSQVISQLTDKCYVSPEHPEPGVVISVTPIDEWPDRMAEQCTQRH